MFYKGFGFIIIKRALEFKSVRSYLKNIIFRHICDINGIHKFTYMIKYMLRHNENIITLNMAENEN